MSRSASRRDTRGVHAYSRSMDGDEDEDAQVLQGGNTPADVWHSREHRRLAPVDTGRSTGVAISGPGAASREVVGPSLGRRSMNTMPDTPDGGVRSRRGLSEESVTWSSSGGEELDCELEGAEGGEAYSADEAVRALEFVGEMHGDGGGEGVSDPEGKGDGHGGLYPLQPRKKKGREVALGDDEGELLGSHWRPPEVLAANVVPLTVPSPGMDDGVAPLPPPLRDGRSTPMLPDFPQGSQEDTFNAAARDREQEASGVEDGSLRRLRLQLRRTEHELTEERARRMQLTATVAELQQRLVDTHTAAEMEDEIAVLKEERDNALEQLAATTAANESHLKDVAELRAALSQMIDRVTSSEAKEKELAEELAAKVASIEELEHSAQEHEHVLEMRAAEVRSLKHRLASAATTPPPPAAAPDIPLMASLDTPPRAGPTSITPPSDLEVGDASPAPPLSDAGLSMSRLGGMGGLEHEDSHWHYSHTASGAHPSDEDDVAMAFTPTSGSVAHGDTVGWNSAGVTPPAVTPQGDPYALPAKENLAISVLKNGSKYGRQSPRAGPSKGGEEDASASLATRVLLALESGFEAMRAELKANRAKHKDDVKGGDDSDTFTDLDAEHAQKQAHWEARRGHAGKGKDAATGEKERAVARKARGYDALLRRSSAARRKQRQQMHSRLRDVTPPHTRGSGLAHQHRMAVGTDPVHDHATHGMDEVSLDRDGGGAQPNNAGYQPGEDDLPSKLGGPMPAQGAHPRGGDMLKDDSMYDMSPWLPDTSGVVDAGGSLRPEGAGKPSLGASASNSAAMRQLRRANTALEMANVSARQEIADLSAALERAREDARREWQLRQRQLQAMDPRVMRGLGGTAPDALGFSSFVPGGGGGTTSSSSRHGTVSGLATLGSLGLNVTAPAGGSALNTTGLSSGVMGASIRALGATLPLSSSPLAARTGLARMPVASYSSPYNGAGARGREGGGVAADSTVGGDSLVEQHLARLRLGPSVLAATETTPEGNASLGTGSARHAQGGKGRGVMVGVQPALASRGGLPRSGDRPATAIPSTAFGDRAGGAQAEGRTYGAPEDGANAPLKAGASGAVQGANSYHDGARTAAGGGKPAASAELGQGARQMSTDLGGGEGPSRRGNADAPQPPAASTARQGTPIPSGPGPKDPAGLYDASFSSGMPRVSALMSPLSLTPKAYVRATTADHAGDHAVSRLHGMPLHLQPRVPPTGGQGYMKQVDYVQPSLRYGVAAVRHAFMPAVMASPRGLSANVDLHGIDADIVWTGPSKEAAAFAPPSLAAAHRSLYGMGAKLPGGAPYPSYELGGSSGSFDGSDNAIGLSPPARLISGASGFL
eukprot:jgi/Mesvir1/24071/Mv10794-RA.1